MGQATLDRIRGAAVRDTQKIKRRAGYGLEPEEEARLKMKRLHLDDASDPAGDGSAMSTTL